MVITEGRRGALVFIGVTALFRARVGDLRASPLNPPPSGLSKALVNSASTDAIHLAAVVCAVLLLSGAVMAWAGLRARPRPAAA